MDARQATMMGDRADSSGARTGLMRSKRKRPSSRRRSTIRSNRGMRAWRSSTKRSGSTD